MKRSILTILAIISLLSYCITAQCAAIKVIVKSECEMTPSQAITVGDIAKVEAPKELAHKVSAVTLGTAPLPGCKRSIDSSYIKLRINAANTGAAIGLQGSDKVTITGKCTRISPETLAEEVKNFMLGQLPQDKRTYDIVIDRDPREILAAAGTDLQIKPRLMGTAVRLGVNSVAIDVIADGKVITTTSASVQIKAVAEVLVTTQMIRQGEALTSDNTSWQQKDITRLPNAIAMGEEEKDWVARRTISANSVVSSSDVQSPAAIKKGDTVTLVVKCGSVTLTTSAEAGQDGRVGETIQVKSSVSQQDVRARVKEAGVVEILR